jgi:hypothetical protein
MQGETCFDGLVRRRLPRIKLDSFDVEKIEIFHSDYEGRGEEAVNDSQTLESDRTAVEAIQRKIIQARSVRRAQSTDLRNRNYHGTGCRR